MKLISRAIVVVALLSARMASADNPPAAGGAGGAAPPAAAPAPAPSTTAPESSPAPAAAPAAPAPTTAAPAPAAPAAEPPVAGAPAPLPTSPMTAEPVKPAGGAVMTGAGLSPNLPQLTAGSAVSARQAEEMAPSTGGAADEWKFQFHGYFRAPLRASWGPPTPIVQPSIYENTPMLSRPPYLPSDPSPSGRELHGLPRVPGAIYGSWDSVNTIGGPWSQLNFTYGNSRVAGTVIVDAWNQTDAGYKNIQAQQGIDQVFLTLNVPEAFGDYGGLVWNIGSFANRYGVAGKYDAGMYETYLFGRTHVAGSTLTANLSNLDAAGNWTVILEQGIGQKLDVVPFMNNQNYQIFQNVPLGQNMGSPFLSDRSPDYLPWSGSVPIGSTYLHHEHLVAKFRNLLTMGAHYLFVWTPDDNWSPNNSMQANSAGGAANSITPRRNGPIQGSMGIWGGEVKLSGGVFGDGYLGWSHIDARNVNALAEAVEVVHSNSGPAFKQTYFGRGYNGHTGNYAGPQNETGTVDTISFQYAFSLGQYARYPEQFWGDGTDLVLTAFGMLSIVDSKAPPIAIQLVNTPGAVDAALAGKDLSKEWDMSTKKLKLGADVFYSALSWLSLGFRFDWVQPDLDAAYSRTHGPENNPRVPEQNPGGSDLNFIQVAPRIVFRTEFLTHETITLLYAHYFMHDGVYPGYPYEWVAHADADAVSLAATLWW